MCPLSCFQAQSSSLLCSWVYGWDGRLRKATRMAGIRNFRAADHGLHPIRLGVWGRFVFLNLGKPPAHGRLSHMCVAPETCSTWSPHQGARMWS